MKERFPSFGFIEFGGTERLYEIAFCDGHGFAFVRVERLRRRTHVPPDPKLVTCLGVSSMLLSTWSPASLRLFGSDRPGRGCTGGSKARPGFLLPGRAFVCPDAPEGLVGTMGVSSSALVS